MEGVDRCLRAAVRPLDADAACTVTVADDRRLNGCEGAAVFTHILKTHAASTASGRAKATRLVVVEGSADVARVSLGIVRRLPESLPTAVVHLRSDPHGWLAPPPDGQGSGRGGAAASEAAGGGGLEAGQATASAGGGTRLHLGDVAGIAAAIAGALGESSIRPAETVGTIGVGGGSDHPAPGGDEWMGAEEEGVGEKVDGGAKAKGKRSSLWGYAPKGEACTFVAIDCVAELVVRKTAGFVFQGALPFPCPSACCVRLYVRVVSLVCLCRRAGASTLRDGGERRGGDDAHVARRSIGPTGRRRPALPRARSHRARAAQRGDDVEDGVSVFIRGFVRRGQPRGRRRLSATRVILRGERSARSEHEPGGVSDVGWTHRHRRRSESTPGRRRRG